MSEEDSGFSAIFDDFIQSTAQILQEYSVIVNSFTSKKGILLSPLPPLPKKRQSKNEENDGEAKQKPKKEEKKKEAKESVPLTQEQKEEVVILAASRSQLDFYSNSFIKNLSKKLPGMKKQEIIVLVDKLDAAGKLKRKETKEQ